MLQIGKRDDEPNIVSYINNKNVATGITCVDPLYMLINGLVTRYQNAHDLPRSDISTQRFTKLLTEYSYGAKISETIRPFLTNSTGRLDTYSEGPGTLPNNNTCTELLTRLLRSVDGSEVPTIPTLSKSDADYVSKHEYLRLDPAKRFMLTWWVPKSKLLSVGEYDIEELVNTLTSSSDGTNSGSESELD